MYIILQLFIPQLPWKTEMWEVKQTFEASSGLSAHRGSQFRCPVTRTPLCASCTLMRQKSLITLFRQTRHNNMTGLISNTLGCISMMQRTCVTEGWYLRNRFASRRETAQLMMMNEQQLSGRLHSAEFSSLESGARLDCLPPRFPPPHASSTQMLCISCGCYQTTGYIIESLDCIHVSWENGESLYFSHLEAFMHCTCWQT